MINDAAITTAKIGTAQITTALIGSAQVTSAKINDFSFNQGTGGTLTLGGTLNGNGVLSVKNSSGAEVVALNKDGITVTNGSITIQNSLGTNIIDSNGIVSTNVFIGSQVTKTSSQTTTNTSFEAVSSFNITTGSFSRSTNILLSCTMTGMHYDADGMLVGRLTYNGTQIGPSFVIGRGMNSTTQYVLDSSVGLSYMYLAPQGVGTIGAVIRQNNNGGTGEVTASFLNSILNYISLGA